MVSKPVDSSMRSKHTGQVGSSIKAGVGGACGLDERELDVIGSPWRLEDVGVGGPFFRVEGVNGSLVISGKEASSPGRS